ncbi:MAG TPA: hypothetical protein VJ915_00935 [Balneolaceae bacterium]|nr:hypothetical protein [Balneolaceae bacterium]
MLFESSFRIVIYVTVLIVVLFTIGYKIRIGQPENDLEKALLDLKIMLITVGLISTVMWVLLPLGSLFSPIAGIEEASGSEGVNEQLIAYTTELGLAVGRIRDILSFFLLIFILGFLGAINQVIKATGYLKKQREKEITEA